MAYRYQGKAKAADKKHGKLARQLDARMRQAEATKRECGHTHTNNGARHCKG